MHCITYVLVRPYPLVLSNQILTKLLICHTKQIMNVLCPCNSMNNFIGSKAECFIQLGFVKLNRHILSFNSWNLSYCCTLINIHHLYTITHATYVHTAYSLSVRSPLQNLRILFSFICQPYPYVTERREVKGRLWTSFFAVVKHFQKFSLSYS